jgi:lysozyme family protein
MNYAEQYAAVIIKPEKMAEVKYAANRVLKGKARYEFISDSFGCPWWFVGIIHVMEGGGDFTKHLHNGDPLTARTVHVPKGRPTGEPPFSWEVSALDALTFMKFNNVTDWRIQNCLELFEKYNGLGYKKRGVPSPYLWSMTQFYQAGKYVTDGHYDPNYVSKQPGVAAIMKVLGVK